MFTAVSFDTILASLNSFLVVVRPESCSLILITQKCNVMRSANTFGVHYTLRLKRPVNGEFPIYLRLTVNKSRCELP